MRAHAVLVAVALILAPIGVKAADLVVWSLSRAGTLT
jgi:hypothetical protein